MQSGREIKFRGRHIETSEFVYGYLIGDDVIVGNIVEWDSEYFNTEFWCKVDPETVGQYTGHRDKNGREIYEKDIWLHQGCETPRVIVWHRYGWWFQYPNGGVTRPMEWTGDGEVIGNIYENPELLQAD
jgi:YopX protein